MKVTEPVLKIPVTEIFSPARARTWLTSKNGKNTRYAVPFRPFVEAHWLHNSRVFGTSMNGVSIYRDGARDIGEINGGVVGMITPEVAFRLMQAFNLENMDTIIHLPC